MNSITLDYSLWVKVGQTFLNLLIGSNRVILCTESSVVRSDVYLFVEDSTIHFQWSVAAQFQYTFGETFTAKFKFIRGDGIATVCLITQTQRSPNIWTLLWRGQALSYLIVCVLHNMFGGRNLQQHQQWKHRHSHLIATSAIPLSFHVWYNLPVLFGKSKIQRICPCPTFRTCLLHRNWWRKCSTAPTFAVLRIEESRPRQWLALCSICALASSISNNELFTWSSFLNSLL